MGAKMIGTSGMVANDGWDRTKKRSSKRGKTKKRSQARKSTKKRSTDYKPHRCPCIRGDEDPECPNHGDHPELAPCDLCTAMVPRGMHYCYGCTYIVCDKCDEVETKGKHAVTAHQGPYADLRRRVIVLERAVDTQRAVLNGLLNKRAAKRK